MWSLSTSRLKGLPLIHLEEHSTPSCALQWNRHTAYGGKEEGQGEGHTPTKEPRTTGNLVGAH